MHYIGIDTGGTFTDGVLVDAEGRLFTAKAATTPDDPSRGVADCVAKLGALREESPQEVLGATTQLAHGTTIGTNAVVERKGPKIALIATRGHGDAILMMRGTGRSTGLPPETVFNILETDKPEPLVPPQAIFEVDERVDCFGEVVVEPDPAKLAALAEELAAADFDAIAISLLWSFKNPAHELQLLELLREAAPDTYVSCSHKVSPTVGEYERTVATVINAYVGQRTSDYLAHVEEWMVDGGLAGDFLVLQCGGGVIPVEDARDVPLLTIGSGPVGGMIGSSELAKRLDLDNVIVTDMGGTSFEVGLIVDGQRSVRDYGVLHQYKYWVPHVDLVSIGAGGGSIAWLDEGAGSLRVGPQSASAVPGPACYGRGGTEPTVTDANLVLGLLDPDAFLGGAMTLDVDAAHTAVGALGDRLGLSADETAAGIRQIVGAHMGGLIRQQTLARGLDTREFTLLAYGGAAPLHAASYSRELGAKEVIVPAGNAASVWSAFGAAVSELLEVRENEVMLLSPFDVGELNAQFAKTEARAAQHAESNGGPGARIERVVKMRFRGQLNQVEVAVPSGELGQAAVDNIVADFKAEYERLFGQGSTTDQPVEITTLRCNIYGRPRDVRITEEEVDPGASAEGAKLPSRSVYWPERGREETACYAGMEIPAGAAVAGPAVITLPFTTVVVPHGWTADRDGWGNFRLHATSL